MSNDSEHWSRRTLLKQGIGLCGFTIGGLIASHSWAAKFIQITPRQALGPFFPDDGDEVETIRETPDTRIPIAQANDQDLTFINGRQGTAKGKIIRLRGRVLDAKTSNPVPNTLIIMWSANASGRYNHKGDDGMDTFPHPITGEIIHRAHDEHFQYWGKAITNQQGHYWFTTIVPGFYPIDQKAGLYRPSHLHFKIMPPNTPQLVTQLYFRGKQIPNNDLNQELLPKDVVVRDAQLTQEELESVIVDYVPDTTGELPNGLIGHYDFIVPR